MNKYPIMRGTLPRPCRKCGEVKFITEMFAKGIAGICRACWNKKLAETRAQYSEMQMSDIKEDSLTDIKDDDSRIELRYYNGGYMGIVQRKK